MSKVLKLDEKLKYFTLMKHKNTIILTESIENYILIDIDDNDDDDEANNDYGYRSFALNTCKKKKTKQKLID